ncbi:MAG: hypothetical protein DRJ38_08320 [Thermoprotei archaeon]|nr:MAG: hypothetical protein DRJ38_08320 [Thermoprotei archaeon]
MLIFPANILALEDSVNGNAILLKIIERTGDSKREYIYLLSKYPLEKIILEAEGDTLTVKQGDIVILRIPLKSSYYTLVCEGRSYSKKDDRITIEVEVEDSNEITVEVVYEMVTLTVDPEFKNVKVYINNLPKRTLKVLKGRKSCWTIDRGVVTVGSGIFATELIAEKTSDCLIVEEDTVVKINWNESNYIKTLKNGLILLLLVALGEFLIVLYTRRKRKNLSK